MMNFSLVSLVALVLAGTLVMALPDPAPPSAEPTIYKSPSVDKRTLEKRTNRGTVLVDGLRYRTCPRISCPVIGKYTKDTHIDIVCHTVDGTTFVNGDPAWAKLTNGGWVSLQYVSWDGTIPFC